MRRTILSENQYDPRFIRAANTNAVIIPFGPPMYSPMSSSRPLRAPSRRVVFKAFGMSLFYLVRIPGKDGQQAGDQGDTPCQIAYQHVFVQRVCAVALWPETI